MTFLKIVIVAIKNSLSRYGLDGSKFNAGNMKLFDDEIFRKNRTILVLAILSLNLIFISVWAGNYYDSEAKFTLVLKFLTLFLWSMPLFSNKKDVETFGFVLPCSLLFGLLVYIFLLHVTYKNLPISNVGFIIIIVFYALALRCLSLWKSLIFLFIFNFIPPAVFYIFNFGDFRYREYFSTAFPVLIGLSLIRLNLHDKDIKCMRLLEMLSELSRKDSLTGLLNKKYYHELLGKILKQDKNFSILIIDIDNFKTINDVHGHLIGDRVIGLISEIILENIRAFDLAGRFGGDEFSIALIDVTLDESIAIADRIREKISSENVNINNRDTIYFTVSIGVAMRGKDIESIDDLIKNADDALYFAKASGKNAVFINKISK